MKYFTDLQIRAIEENLSLHPLKTDEILEKLENLKVTCANMYIQKYGIFANNIYDASKLFSKKKVCIHYQGYFFLLFLLSWFCFIIILFFTYQNMM